MFDNKERIIDKVSNPLNITNSSIIEFKVGELVNTGLYRFKKIIVFDFEDRTVVKYIIYSNVDNTEFVFEYFSGNNGLKETYLYSMTDTIPFSEDFLGVAGQLYLTTPQGNEYIRCIMPELDSRIDGIRARVKVYDVEAERIEKEFQVEIWDYQRDVDGLTEYLCIEMSKSTGMFKIFIGEMIEEVFYKFYQTSK